MTDQTARKQLDTPDGATASRETDANVLQRRAARPDRSAWVGASAGAGKTKVLTDRMMRLMLPRADGRPGSLPGNILALTFTKAAANEMALRLTRRLGEWAVLADDTLSAEMKDLLGQDPTDAQTRAARQLFARVVDAPGGMKIMTIHSFCQSILGRFPLEAGLPPGFTPLEEGQDIALLQQAQKQVLARAAAEKTSPLARALHHLAGMQDEDSFTGLIGGIIRERAQLSRLLASHFGAEGIYTALCQRWDVQAGADGEAVRAGMATAPVEAESALRRACKAQQENGTPTDQKRGQDIQAFLDSPVSARPSLYALYRHVFLTNDMTVRNTLATKDTLKACPDAADILSAEAERLREAEERARAADAALATRDLLILGAAILDTYTDLKEQRGALDFDDLILKTLALLEGRTMGLAQEKVAPWVRFKLDQGIDHILVDEAQDTNPEQWDIIRALCEDFFTGDSGRDMERTVFVVGDEKQSIFSFQRANPRQMSAMQDWFARRIAQAGQQLETVPINISFRSAPAILHAVDKIFEADDWRGGLGRTVLPHAPFRHKQPGLVELWPPMVTIKNDEENGDTNQGWLLPLNVSEVSSGAARLAAHIGDTIKGWIDNQEELPARGRAIDAGDILILVRTRTAFVGQLVRALKTRGVPVSGVDRMVLKDQLAVQDLLSAAAFGLLPEDDLALAELLKSPLVGWDDDALYTLAQPRGERQSLWAALRAQDGHGPLKDWLGALIRRAASDHPFEFFSRLLQEDCPADAISGLRAIRARLGEDAIDPLDEFMARTLGYETGNIPTLQGFVHWHDNEAADIKREMEEAGRAVRIMTVHASKGLQAPIVILPDTFRDPSARRPEKLLWPDRSGFDLPLFLAAKETMPEAARPAFDAVLHGQEEEYARLLYVALTRAEDRLYIGGYHSRKPLERSWYHAIRTGLESLPGIERHGDPENPILRLTNPATDGPDKKPKDRLSGGESHAPAPWLRADAPAEPTPPRPLVPSRPSGPLPPAASPRAPKDTYRFRRGTLTHTLLQFLPDLPAETRQTAASGYLDRAGADLPASVRADIVVETLAVLADPTFAPLFGPGSLAEISVTGLVADDTLIAGQIDRLLVTDDDILIVDFKTNRPPPERAEDIPPLYQRQLQAYADALVRIYPGRRVRAALLWTDGARLMEVPLAA